MLLVLIYTCVLFASSEEIFEQSIYQRCLIKPATVCLSKAEDTTSYSTLIVDSQILQSDVFEKDEPRSPGVLTERCNKKRLTQLSCYWGDRSDCHTIDCAQQSYYQRVEHLCTWKVKIDYNKLIFIIINKLTI